MKKIIAVLIITIILLLASISYLYISRDKGVVVRTDKAVYQIGEKGDGDVKYTIFNYSKKGMGFLRHCMDNNLPVCKIKLNECTWSDRGSKNEGFEGTCFGVSLYTIKPGKSRSEKWTIAEDVSHHAAQPGEYKFVLEYWYLTDEKYPPRTKFTEANKITVESNTFIINK